MENLPITVRYLFGLCVREGMRMNKFTYEGNAYIKRPFKIEVRHTNDEKALEIAMRQLEKDADDPAYFAIGEDELTLDVHTYESEKV